jgi:hypothetical protein
MGRIQGRHRNVVMFIEREGVTLRKSTGGPWSCMIEAHTLVFVSKGLCKLKGQMISLCRMS